MGRNNERFRTATALSLQRLRELLTENGMLPNSCRRVAQYTVDNPEAVASMPIDRLAQVTGSSKTAVVRLCKLAGYAGYREMRAALIENRGVLRGWELLDFDVPWRVGARAGIMELARDVLRINLEILHETIALLDEQRLRRAVDLIVSAQRVFLLGFGTSAPVAQDAYQRFLRLLGPSWAISDPHVIASVVANMTDRDLLFCVSYTGSSRDIVEALETARRRNAPAVLLTSAPLSIAARLSDVVLVSAVRRKPPAAETVASRISQLAIIDVLCAVIALKKKERLRAATVRIKSELRRKRIENRRQII